METTTLVATFGLLAFMVERLTNGIAIVAGYSSWWRDRMEVDATADPEIRARVERNRRVGLFALSAILGVIGAVLLKLDFLSKVGFEILPSAPAPVPVPAGNQAAGTSAVYSIQEIGHYVVTGLLIAAGADPIRELLKLGDRPREPPAPLQITGTLILQQPPPAASVKAETDRVSSLSA